MRRSAQGFQKTCQSPTPTSLSGPANPSKSNSSLENPPTRPRLMSSRTTALRSETSDMCDQLLSDIWLFVALWTEPYQSPLSMDFSRREYWSGLPFPTPGDLRDSGIEPTFFASPVLVGRFFSTVLPGKPFSPSFFPFLTLPNLQWIKSTSIFWHPLHPVTPVVCSPGWSPSPN